MPALQQSKSLELRATLSLSRLWQQRRRKREARETQLVSEGFDDPDLREARPARGARMNRIA